MLRALVLSGTLLLGLTVPTLADDATTLDGQFVNVRSGPGMKYSRVCVAWPGVRFTVSDCGRNWCSANYLGKDGWISVHHIEIQQ